MKNQKLVSLRPIIVITASAILSVLFILILYYADNKYTVGGKQPELGRLELTLGDMEEKPYRYLITGWEFYPDLLLGPDAFDGAEKPAGVTAAVGKYGQMRRNQRGTKGTYRLVLVLPEKGGPFALELPEIEGASRVYIGGELVREWGSIEDVRSGMKRFVFPLTQGRDTELIIQAAALGAFHSQNFSPPLLGVYDAVTGIRDVGLLLKVMVLGLAVSAAGLSLHLAVKIRWWRGFLFCLFCLCFVGYQLWPLARERIQLGLQPWYGIQVFCFYAMLWLMVILENDLYRIKGGKVSAAMGIFCILALVYGCYAQYGTAAAADLFSYITQWYKFAIACHLILVAYMAMAEGMERSQTLLVIAVVLVSALFMEQLLPLYEPIIGGSFLTIGCVVIMVGMLSILWQDMADAFRARTFFVTETGRMNRQLAMQREHYRQLNARIEETRRIRHDMRHHIRLLQAYTAEGNLEHVKAYLGQLSPAMDSMGPVTFTSNYALDAVLCHYAALAEKEKIETDIRVMVPGRTVLADDELCVVMGNLLENAVEACKRQESGRKFIFLRCLQDDSRLSIVLDNSFMGDVQYERGYFRSSKRESVGIGVESVKAIVKRHGGIGTFVPEEKVFKVSIILPLKDEG